MIGEKVIHNTFGEGEIIEVKSTEKFWQQHITVRFSSLKKLFIYPDAFENFLYAKSGEFQSAVESAICLKNTEMDKERLIAQHNLKMKMLQYFFDYTRKQLEALLEEKNLIDSYTQLKSGDACGTDTRSVFQACVNAFGWYESEISNFGQDTDNYSNIATPEGYSVWFLEREDWSKHSNYDTELYVTYEEKWWQECSHPTRDERKKLIFAKKDDNFLFMGVFEFFDVKKQKRKDGECDCAERFKMVSEEYPWQNKF